MIKTQNLTPEVYYKESRDFQLLGRTFDFLINHIKLNSDLINTETILESSDSAVLDLLATTLGFKKAHEYNNKQLRGLCSMFMLAMKNKGNITSIQYILDMLCNVEDVAERAIVEINPNDLSQLNIYVPLAIKDISILNDVLDYILPVGMTAKIIKQQLSESTFEISFTELSETVGTPKHAYETSQVMLPDMENLPQPADIEMGRIDNITVVTYDENNLDILANDIGKPIN